MIYNTGMVSANATLSWADIEPLISDEKYKAFLKEIDPAVYKLVLDETKRLQVTASILTMLQSSDPDNATEEYAKEIVEMMIKVAEKF